MYIQSIQIAMCVSQTIAYSCYPYDPRIIASIHAGCFSNNIEFQVEWCCILFSIYSARKAKCLHAPSSKYRLEMHILNTPLSDCVHCVLENLHFQTHTHNYSIQNHNRCLCVRGTKGRKRRSIYIYIFMCFYGEPDRVIRDGLDED